MAYVSPFLFPGQDPLPTVEVQHDGQTWTRTDLGGVLGDEWIEHRDGVPWFDRPRPRRWHRCRPATRGHLDGDLVERCACGATRFPRRWSSWGGKNERRS